jgi:ABC-type phosphate/phosphonate transport system ATPase subunit
MIELKNITKTFHQKDREVTALAGVSLTVGEGRIVGVIGASGAGKSTLIRCVNLLERPTSGEVIVDGTNMLNLSAAQLTQARRQIGMIFQHTLIYCLPELYSRILPFLLNWLIYPKARLTAGLQICWLWLVYKISGMIIQAAFLEGKNSG